MNRKGMGRMALEPHMQRERDDDYKLFITQIRRRFHVDLFQYKEAQMKRRLTTLRERRGYSTFQDYFEALVRNPELAEEFLNRITINVSEFFRNKERWKDLERSILPRIFRENKAPRFWSAACSTGEEPYSLALLLTRFQAGRDGVILATDIDEVALAKAKEGIYEERTLKEIDPNLLSRYFQKEGGSYRVAPEIRRMVTFQKHDLLVDSYPNGFDLILCRNVMIYFTDEAKETMIEKFSRSLKTGGFLFVGSTEQIFNPGKFSMEMASPFIYRKI
ncbi:methyl-accepting chemotaxis proteins (MCPs) methyltransferase [[Clostridium] ultunense Esp]|nr:methyl-accepting chemotaxis proteins (MCPs) methyltransferase [[Clostridium] ultunense Esp]